MPNTRGTVSVIIAVLVVLIAGAALYYGHSRSQLNNNNTDDVQKYTHIDITLEDGQIKGFVSTYEVNPGTGLEFSINSNKLGKIGVPVDPPQTITFTQSPLVFHFAAPSKAGTYPMSYQADGNEEVIQIGIISVKSTK